MDNTEIALRNDAPALPAAYGMSVREVVAQASKIQECMKALMREGEHYGASFPGDAKKNLLKPGADKLCFMFRFRPDFRQESLELPGGHREIRTRCEIFHIETGVKLAEGVGTCSTMESKYRWRKAALKCPACGKETIIKGKAEYGGGWVCYAKNGGCGAKYRDGDAAVEKQKTGKIENPDIADTYNTVLKMSKKRAYVDAVITACAASDIFTQDAEDLREYAAHDGGGDLPPKPPAAPQKPAPAGNAGNGAAPPQNGGGREFDRLKTEIAQMLRETDGGGANVFSDRKYNETMAATGRLKPDAAGLEELRRIHGGLKSVLDTATDAALIAKQGDEFNNPNEYGDFKEAGQVFNGARARGFA
jgi:hypothetical protein